MEIPTGYHVLGIGGTAIEFAHRNKVPFDLIDSALYACRACRVNSGFKRKPYQSHAPGRLPRASTRCNLSKQVFKLLISVDGHTYPF